MKILIYGAGVIGSLYAAKIASRKKFAVTVLARGKRLKELNEKGLLLKSMKSSNIETANINIISELSPDDIYDFIFVTLRKDQVESILPILRNNKTKNILFMVNNPSGPSKWIEVVGKERIILGFPGAGGKRENGIVHYHVVSSLIQPTTIGEVDRKYTERIKALSNVLKEAGFKVAVSSDMDCWQKSHLALVSPMANVIYKCGGDNYTVTQDKKAINLMNKAIREGLMFLRDAGFTLISFKTRFILYIPMWILNKIMLIIYNTKWAETVISNHALIAREEMKILADEFIQLAHSRGVNLPNFEELAKYI